MYSTYIPLFEASEVTVTSQPEDLSLRQNKSLQFKATDITSGSGTFTVEVSNDGATWTAYNRLTTNVTNTNVQNDTRVSSVVLNSAGSSSAFVFIPHGDHFRYIRVTCTVATDGKYSAYLSAYSN